MSGAPADFQEARRRLASQVRRIRVARGLTQEAAADGAGLAVRHFQKIEAEEVNVTLDTLCKLAAALGVDVSELLQPVEGK